MNHCDLTGRLTKDPVVRYSSGENQMCVARFTLAVNRRVAKNAEGGQKADFISCVGFGKKGEFVEKYAKKGMKFDISGRIQTGSYKDKNGKDVYTTEVVVEDIEFGESKTTQTTPETNDGFTNVPDELDDQLPFN